MDETQEVAQTKPEQLSLWELENPLKPQIPAAFFKSVPASAGVYRLLSEHDEILYVGKAKNLRVRLRYYRSKTLMNGSRKLRELVRRVRKVDFELCNDEAAALVRENQLLAKIKPPYNVVNTRPEAYTYIGLRKIDSSLELRFAFEKDVFGDDFEVYGAFRGPGQSLRSFGALLRQIHFWLGHECLWPLQLIRPKTPRYFEFHCGDDARLGEVYALVRLVLCGDFSVSSVQRPKVLEGRFYEAWWSLDMERLKTLSRACSQLQNLRNTFGLNLTYIEKSQLNDYASLYPFKSKS